MLNTDTLQRVAANNLDRCQAIDTRNDGVSPRTLCSPRPPGISGLGHRAVHPILGVLALRLSIYPWDRDHGGGLHGLSDRRRDDAERPFRFSSQSTRANCASSDGIGLRATPLRSTGTFDTPTLARYCSPADVPQTTIVNRVTARARLPVA